MEPRAETAPASADSGHGVAGWLEVLPTQLRSGRWSQGPASACLAPASLAQESYKPRIPLGPWSGSAPNSLVRSRACFLAKGPVQAWASRGHPTARPTLALHGEESLSPQILLSTKAKLGNRPYFPNSDFVELLCKHVPCSKARWPEQCAAHRQEASWARHQQLKGPSGVWPGAVVGVGRSKGHG